MGAYKQKMFEEMRDEDHTDEYGAFMDNDNDDHFEEQCEESAIEQSIENAWIEADMERQDRILQEVFLTEIKRVVNESNN